MSTTPHTHRIPDDVWEPASARAEAEHHTMTGVIVQLLRGYGNGTIQLGATQEPAPVLAAELAQPSPSRADSGESGEVKDGTKERRGARKPGEPEDPSEIMAAIRNRRSAR